MPQNTKKEEEKLVKDLQKIYEEFDKKEFRF